MIPEKNTVYLKLRVTPPESKHSVVFNGISANDWLCPGGISSKQKSDPSSVSIETLSKRPHTANSILVIRQNPQYRGLEKYETLTGNSYNTGSGSNSQTSDSNLVRPPTSIKRPMTAFSSRNLKRGIALASHYNIASNNAKNPDLDLTIQSTHCKEMRSQKLCWNVAPDINKVEPTRETFDTIEGIRRSYQTRAQSAPASVNRTQITTQRTKTNLYWRAKSTYHRKNLNKEESTEESNKFKTTNSPHQEQHGSLLRPLLFSSEGVIKHSAGCPYKCKGCFKACLVSQDYLNRNQEATQTSWRKQRRIKRGPGFAVEFALAKSQPLYQLLHKHKNDGNKSIEAVQTKTVDETKRNETVISPENHDKRNHKIPDRLIDTKPFKQSEMDHSKNSPSDHSQPLKNDQCEPNNKDKGKPLDNDQRKQNEKNNCKPTDIFPFKSQRDECNSSHKAQCTSTKVDHWKPTESGQYTPTKMDHWKLTERGQYTPTKMDHWKLTERGQRTSTKIAQCKQPEIDLLAPENEQSTTGNNVYHNKPSDTDERKQIQKGNFKSNGVYPCKPFQKAQCTSHKTDHCQPTENDK